MSHLTPSLIDSTNRWVLIKKPQQQLIVKKETIIDRTLFWVRLKNATGSDLNCFPGGFSGGLLNREKNTDF